MKNFEDLASKESVEKTIAALKTNGINAFFAETEEEAKAKVLEIIPKGASVMTMTSVTLSSINILDEINESGNYDSVRKRLNSMNRETESREMQVLGAAPEWSIGSVNAVTSDGKVLVASNTGSQLPAYAYASDHVIWVIGTQKIAEDLDEGIKRIYEYVLPLESERAQKAYGMPHSNVSKLLIFNKEIKPGRITAIFVNKALGF